VALLGGARGLVASLGTSVALLGGSLQRGDIIGDIRGTAGGELAAWWHLWGRWWHCWGEARSLVTSLGTLVALSGEARSLVASLGDVHDIIGGKPGAWWHLWGHL